MSQEHLGLQIQGAESFQLPRTLASHTSEFGIASSGSASINVPVAQQSGSAWVHREDWFPRPKPRLVELPSWQTETEVISQSRLTQVSRTMSRAIESAVMLVRLAAVEEERDYLTNLRLQKLLYYVQAWSLVMRRKPMFQDRIEAWVHGPVVPSVYRHFSHKGPMPIVEADVENVEIELDEEEASFVASVWETYKAYSALKLREMTPSGGPLDQRSKRL